MTVSKVGVTVRKGRKVVYSNSKTKDIIELLLADAFKYDIAKAMTAFPTLKSGNTFKFKHNGLNVTLEPLVDYVDTY